VKGDVRDLIVIGGGSGGIAAAQSAKFRGATVAIVQDGPIGGDCTWNGCIPSKALLAAASRGEPFDMAMASVQAAIDAIAAAEDAEMLRHEGIEVIEGRGTIVVRTGGVLLGVEVGEVTHQAKSIIVSPGSKPLVPPIGGLADVGYLTNETIFSLSEQPKHLLIVGGGPIGCEMAEAFSSLGSVVTLIEGADRLMPRDDADAAAVITRSLGRHGVGVRTGVFVSEVAATGLGVAATLSDESSVEGSHVLIATGRAPNHGEMGLEAVGVELTDCGWINVDEHLQTSIKGVYAVGDAIGGLQLTHAAGHQARLATENALRVGMTKVRKHRYDPGEIPWVTFTSPEVAQVGVTEEQARSIKGAKVAEVPLSAVDRAVAVDRADGFIKLIAVPRKVIGMAGGGRLIGATIVADRAGELAGEVALAIRTKMFAGRLAQTVHAYPTWSIGLQYAAAQFIAEYDGRSARDPR